MKSGSHLTAPRHIAYQSASVSALVTLLIMAKDNPEAWIVTAGGRIRCLQCSAQSKRTKLRCRSPAVRGKKVCRIHGGLSTGPRTPEGKARSVEAKTVHGRDTRAIRQQASLVAQHLVEVEVLGRTLGMFTGPRIRGRRPG
jgi:hypothetical protein